MNIKTELLSEHFKVKITEIVSYVGNDLSRFEKLMLLFLTSTKGEGYKLPHRASLAISICVENNPFLIIPYWPQLISILNNSSHNTIIRNIIRIWQFVHIPDEYLGDVADYCFKTLTTKSEPVANKAFSITVLMRVVQKEPALANELRIVIEDQLPYETPAFTSRGRKALKILNQM